MTLRKVFFWMHLCTGSVAGLVVLIMSATGVLLAYERQINAWADRGFRHAAPSASAGRLPVETLLAGAKGKVTGTPTGLTLKSDREAPAALEFGRQRMVYLNPYTGEVLGEGSQATRTFFQQVEQWHRFLAFSGASRATARMVTRDKDSDFAQAFRRYLAAWPTNRASSSSTTSRTSGTC